MHVRLLVLATLVLCLAATALAQKRYYIGGSFSRLNGFSRPGYFCYNTTAWAKTTASYKANLASFSPIAFLNGNEGYYFDNAQLFYFNTSYAYPVFEGKGVFKRQELSTDKFTPGSVTAILINRAQTRLWVAGTFTRIGSLPFNTKGTNQLDGIRIALFDISESKTNPTQITLSAVDGTIVSFDFSRAFTQGNNLVVLANQHTTLGVSRLWRIDSANKQWIGLTNPSQSAQSAIYKTAADESIWAYHTTDLLDQQIPALIQPSNTIIQRLDATSTVFTKVIQNQATTNPTEILHPSKWAPNANKELFFILQSTATGSTKDVLDNQRNLNQYIYKIKDGIVKEKANPDGRLASDANSALFTFSDMSSLVSDLVYDEANKALVVIGSSIRSTINGAYQSKEADTVKGLIPEDRTKYSVKPLTPGVVWLKDTEKTFSPAFGGGFDISGLPGTFAALGYRGFAKETCFFTTRTVYDVFSPYAAMFDSGKWQQIPGVTSQFEDDIVNGDSLGGTAHKARINVIERITTSTNEHEAFFGGYFRTLGGTIYNSIFFYNNMSKLEQLGPADTPGLTAYSRLGDIAPGAPTSPDDQDFSRYYGLLQGTVSAMVFDPSSRNLYVAGTFYRAGSLYVRNIARWNHNTRTWFEMDGGLNSAANKLVLHGGNVYAIGGFTYAGSTHVRGIAMFNTRTEKWESLGQGIQSGSPVDAVSYMGRLYVSVNSGHASGATINFGIFAWNAGGAFWSPIMLKREQSTINNNLCATTATCSATNAAFYIIADKLWFSVSGVLFLASGDVFTQYAGSFGTYLVLGVRNGIKPGTKVTLTLSGATIGLETDSANDSPSWEYTPERQDIFVDSSIFAFSASPKTSLSFFALAIALALCLFMLFN